MFERILDSIFDSVLITDPTGTIMEVNETCCRTLGYERKALLGMDVFSILSKGEASAILDPAHEKKKRGLRLSLRAADGAMVLVKANVQHITHKGEEAILCVARDITERARAEEALREKEETYHAVLEGIGDGYWETDLAGRLTFVNDVMCRMAGATREELLSGVRFSDYADSEARKRIYGIFEEVYRTGNPSELGDHEIIRRDGSRGVFQFNASLIRNKEGQPAGFRGITRDVTERRAMEEALRESEEQYRTILEGMEEGYYEVDLAGRFTFFNSALCRMGGVSAEELMGMRNLEYAAPGAAKMIYQTFNEVYRTGKPAEIVDHEIIKKDGSRSMHELSVSLMRNKEGIPIGFRGVVRDVTLRKQAEEEIKIHREHLALINQILRHDLTNDLIVAQSGLNLYKISHEDELLEETEGRIKKSLDLIGRMRELESFISSHKDLKAYKIRDVISEIAGNYPFITVKIKGKAQVMADDSLFSVIDNITRNAVIHGKSDRIEVAIGQREGMCEVRIADDGWVSPMRSRRRSSRRDSCMETPVTPVSASTSSRRPWKNTAGVSTWRTTNREGPCLF